MILLCLFGDCPAMTGANPLSVNAMMATIAMKLEVLSRLICESFLSLFEISPVDPFKRMTVN